ncbi:MAG: TIGR03617 family F420-dependent LLM class oxidoreductase [Anaerolineales bacterium]|nr:TIGR03617 family F420-dependent LLM class oxidoreductase [Anaerolineales bacterium]
MHLDATLPYDSSLKNIPAAVQAAELFGFSGLWTAETQHDPFLPGPLIAEHTSQISFGTAIAVAFARSPGNLAHIAWDLAAVSGGRFILGLGTQVKPHIERRFGMPWPESVTGKLREQIRAIRALWQTWQTGERLNFRGEYYKLTLMSPFFNPGPIEHPNIPIFIAGVNTGLAKLAGELADGFHVHPLHSPLYLREVLIPAIEEGAARTGRDRAAVQITCPVFIATSLQERQFVRQQISFYASTPSYHAVMALHGWGDTANELSELASRGKWEAMPSLITSEMLHTFAVIAEPDHLAEALKSRYNGGIADRLTPYLPFVPGERDAFWQSLASVFRDEVTNE